MSGSPLMPVFVSVNAPRHPRIHRSVRKLFNMHQALMLAVIQTEKTSYENAEEASILLVGQTIAE